MAADVADWVRFQLGLIPDFDAFEDALQRASQEWIAERPGPEAVGPLLVLGRISLLLRHAPPGTTARLEERRERFADTVSVAIREARERFEGAVAHVMNYKLSIAEGVISTMTGLSVAGIQKVMNLLEVEEEFFDFAEDAFLTLQGLRALKVDLDVSGWERRMTSLREEWARMAPLVAAAFGDKLHGVRMRGMRIKPPEYWWEHTLADAARG